ncbi:MAG: hypothetical protein WKG07_05790 [Hymenobacter sp.]
MEKNDERPLNDGFSDDYVPRRFREGANEGERRTDLLHPRGERDDRRPAGNDGASRARPQRPFYDGQGRQVMPSRDRNAAPYKGHHTRPAADRSIDMLFRPAPHPGSAERGPHRWTRFSCCAAPKTP